MAMLEIKNIGPVKEAKLDLNKVNVFMGKQSSGKSTIAKIISYCTWVEKDVATSQSLEKYLNNKNYFRERLENYHKIKGYFKTDSYVSYKSDVVDIKYDTGLFFIDWVDRFAYKRSKISYIPSERNLVVLPEIEKVTFSENNIRGFLFDWFDVRKKYSVKDRFALLDLGIDYYYAEESRENHIKVKTNDNQYDILLSNASSGLQSITPLIVMVDCWTNWKYIEIESISYDDEEKKKRVSDFLIDELILKPHLEKDTITGEERLREFNNFHNRYISNSKEIYSMDKINLFNKYCNVSQDIFSTKNSQFIIEEPEQNLFPETQRDLIYYLLEKCLDEDKDHRLTMTTHSPYILYALNNCMLGGLVYEKMSDADKAKIKCKSALIHPKKVSVYEIHDGVLMNIQQEDGLIGDNYFDGKMKELMDDFYVMLNYYN
jgi:predicted ATPase